MLADVAILALAVWRITAIVTAERGPFAVATRLRELVGVEHDDDGKVSSFPDTELGLLVTCDRCCSVWVGALLGGLYLWAPGSALVLALPFALSAVAVGLGGLVDGAR